MMWKRQHEYLFEIEYFANYTRLTGIKYTSD